ncbi:MAG: glutathione S-transferase N-terminal domain-containing protein [Burkholderiaceae bacterium]|nr:glutathione S-transferase N-terminal domain-containing protein [Sulfuritalea sp.]MCF8174499.1 glutathione S-transferase N-terminal domain-containing protein [Burkholderiaceae bacterium]MCF8183457.1 glutathione S-transferase N-terminal domain-containing protein [Polynucleobacter sp.]
MKTAMRMFFKALRFVIGPLLLLWEYVSRPKGVVRTPERQTEVDQQCRQMALYQYQTCPFCIKVRQEMRRLSLKIERLDAQHDESNRANLLRGGGQAKVPCLKITDAKGESSWMYESTEIIRYLRGRFSAT